jgi:hypothetical protein
MSKWTLALFLFSLAGAARAQPGPPTRVSPAHDETYVPLPAPPPPRPVPLDDGGGDDDDDRDLPGWRHDPDSISAYAFGLYGAGMWGWMDDYELSAAPGWDDLGPLVGAHPRLDGHGGLAGGGFRGTFQSDWGIRFGLGFNALFGDGWSLEHEPLPEGVTAELGRLSVANFEVFLGKAFDATHVYPYLDVKLGINVVLAQIDLRTAELGYVGSSTYVVPSLSLAPRTGLFVPLDGDWFIDVSGQYSFIGLERAAGFAGFGTWTD